VVPAGPAHRLPFAALPHGGQTLLVTHTLSVLPSASAIALLDQGPAAVGPLLALSDPADMTYRPLGEPLPGKWEPLPWMGAAAAYCARLDRGSELLLGGEATEAGLRGRVGRFPLVLLGTHAELDDAPPRAYVVLARGDGLELPELLGLDFRHTALVVLAACETARGAVTGGDEVMGLSRGLLAAGASRAVLTLWKTDAESAPLFLHALFRRLYAGEPPAAAMAAAQLELAKLDGEAARDRWTELVDAAAATGHPVTDEVPHPSVGYDHPRHWAPWVLVGR
jgi:CHAT domain-containing protein